MQAQGRVGTRVISRAGGSVGYQQRRVGSVVALAVAAVVVVGMTGGRAWAEYVVDTGTPGTDGVAGTGANGGNGGAASATAASPIDYYNQADAYGGNGGSGATPAVPGNPGGAGGKGGDADATAEVEGAEYDFYLDVRANAVGGNGGAGMESGRPEDGGAASSVVSASSIVSLQDVYMLSNAYGGSAGSALGTLPVTLTGVGGSGSATGSATVAMSTLDVTLYAQGGWGSTTAGPNGNGGMGGIGTVGGTFASAADDLPDRDTTATDGKYFEVDVKATGFGGTGGNALGAGFTSGTGAGATSSGLHGSTSGTGDVSVKLDLHGGPGGYGQNGASGGAGGDVVVSNGVSGSTTIGLLYLKQEAWGGTGGASDFGTPGAGGVGSSALTASNAGGGAMKVHLIGNGGWGGGATGDAVAGADGTTSVNLTNASDVEVLMEASGGQGGTSSVAGHGGNGGGATASGSVTSAGGISLIAKATGGWGGNGMGAGKHGGDGTAGTLGAFNLVSTGAGAIYAEVEASGGSGGYGGAYPSGADAGDGAAVSLNNKIFGTTSGDLTLVQRAYGGGGGYSYGGGAAGLGGSATSTMNLTRTTGGAFSAWATAVGGGGGGTDGSSGPAMAGAAGQASVTLVGGVSPVTATAESWGGYGGSNYGGNGGAAGASSASAAATGAGDVTVTIQANGGGGGLGSGVGFTGANGGLPTWSYTPPVSTGGGNVTTNVSVGGGWGGWGNGGAAGGDGASVSLNNVAVAGSTSGGGVTLSQWGYSGGGGPGWDGGEPGDGGVATSTLTYNRVTAGDVEVRTGAVGGYGGEVRGSSGLNAKPGASAMASATGSGLGNVTVSGEAWGGGGGRAETATGNGGNGALGVLGTVFGSSTGGNVSVRSVRTSGWGGNAEQGGNGGSSPDVTESNFVDGSAPANKEVDLEQNAYGGAGGWAEAGTAARGADASSSLSRVKSQSLFLLRSVAFGGDGGSKTHSTGTGARGGHGTASSTTENPTGEAKSDLYAGGGAGGDGSDGAGGGAGGNATGTSASIASGVGQFARANGGAGAGRGGDILVVPLTGAAIHGGNGGVATVTGTATSAHGPAVADVFATAGRGGTYEPVVSPTLADENEEPLPMVFGGTGGAASATSVSSGAVGGDPSTYTTGSAYAEGGAGGRGDNGGDDGDGGNGTAQATASGPGNVQSFTTAIGGKAGGSQGTQSVSGLAWAKSTVTGAVATAYSTARSTGRRYTRVEGGANGEAAGTSVLETKSSVGRAHPAVGALGVGRQAVSVVTADPLLADIPMTTGLSGLLGSGSENNILLRADLQVATNASASATQTYRASAQFEMDPFALSTGTALYGGLLAGSSVGSSIERLNLNVLRGDGFSYTFVSSTYFASLGDAVAYFKDHPIGLGVLDVGQNNFWIELEFQSKTPATGFGGTFVIGPAAAGANQWVASGGSFSDPANWSGGAPPAAGGVINLLRGSFGGSVGLTANTTFSVINVDNDYGQSIDGVAALETTSAVGATRQINVMTGPDLYVGAPLKVHGDLDINGVLFGGGVRVYDMAAWDAGKKVTVNGGGTLYLSKNTATPAAIGAGAQLVIKPGARVIADGVYDSLSNGGNRVSVVNESPSPLDLYGYPLNGFEVQSVVEVGTVSGGGNTMISEGTLTADSLRQNKLSIYSTSRLNLRSGASPTTSVIKQLELQFSAFTTRVVDLTKNRLVWDYDVESAADRVRGYLRNGYHNGAWDGTIATMNILSSTAAGDAQKATGIGYVEASELLGLSGSATAVWNGVVVDATSLLIKYTYFGDANLDGRVGPDDFALIDRGYAMPAGDAMWVDGDFNYDGIVNAQDYLRIDVAFGHQSGGVLSAEFLAVRGAQFGEGYVRELLAAVPEPSMFGVCGMAALGIGRRRRR